MGHDGLPETSDDAAFARADDQVDDCLAAGFAVGLCVGLMVNADVFRKGGVR